VSVRCLELSDSERPLLKAQAVSQTFCQFTHTSRYTVKEVLKVTVIMAKSLCDIMCVLSG